MTAEIGRVLGGRYRLVAPIGMGASAQVYLADDVKLRRRVALKMLHDALADDAEFLRRFRAEARAAAALSHPNVMAVYDWGDGSDEGETAFIVTEYLPGGSLRALLDGGNLLTTAQALDVGLQAARALDYAHRRGFVHRDIKPANLLFGEEQRLRIADFGLARALAEAAWTEPQGAMLGTARYASPEQAKGESLTGKADVYALGLVLIEAVTGSVPFAADTTLGTLMARVDTPVPVPEALGPLRDVLVGAGASDPAQRIDARELAKGLLRAARHLPRPAALPLAGALAGATLANDLDPTVHAPGPDLAASAASDLTSEDLELDPPPWVNQSEPPPAAAGALLVAGAAGAAGAVAGSGLDAGPPGGPDAGDEQVDALDDAGDAVDPDGAGESETDAETGDPETGDPEAETNAGAGHDLPEGVPADDTDGPGDGDPTVADDATAVAVAAGGPPVTSEVPAVAVDPAEPGDGEDPSEDGRSRRRRWPWLVFALVVLAGIAAGVLVGRDQADPEPPVVLPVPELVGRTEQQATAVLTAAGWEVEVERVRRDGTTEGEVLSTDPAGGTRLADGDTVVLTVSEGQTIAAVPTDLGGQSLDEATEALEAAGFRATVAEERFSEDLAEGVVVGVVEGTPAELEKGSEVPLVVSKGPEPRTIPSGLAGQSGDEVTQILNDLGLEVAIVRSFSDSVDEGIVISTLPAAGDSAERGSTVTVEVSQGPELVAVPSLASASSISEAISIIESAGLTAGSVSGPASGSPVGTSPAAGTEVRVGSSVDIVLG
jgi:serine/threonine-protein kinase